MKSTIDIPDALLKEAKLRALEDSTTLREVVINALQGYLFDKAEEKTVVNEEAVAYDNHSRVDSSGWPVLIRKKGDDTVVTEEFINDMREELGV